jgi:hypothetical protein
MLLSTNARRWAAGGFAAAVLLAGAGFARLTGDDKPAAKDDKPAIDPKDVRVGPPPELAELRKAVEDAAKKGENVDEIRKQLDALEKVLAGKAWVKPKPIEEPPAPSFQPQPAVPLGGNFNRMPQGGRILVQPPVVIGGLDADVARLQAEMLRDMAQQRELLLGGRVGALPEARAAALAGARLGVRVEKAPAALTDQLGLPAGRGLVVAEVRPGSPADKGGLKVNDVILEFDGKPVTDNATDFVRAVEAAPKDRKVDLTVLRKGKKEAIKGVELPENARRVPPVEQPPALPPLGLRRPPAFAADAAPIARLGAVEANSVSVRVADGMFTLTADQDGVKYVIEGTVAAKAQPSKIQITDGNKPKVEVDSLEKVPAEYRKQVDALLGSIRVGRD